VAYNETLFCAARVSRGNGIAGLIWSTHDYPSLCPRCRRQQRPSALAGTHGGICRAAIRRERVRAGAGRCAPAAVSPEQELEQLVGRIALYPDDLVAIILPAATNPLQIVQADRFLEKRKADPKAPLDKNGTTQ